MQPQEIEEVIQKLNYYKSQSQRLLKTINTMVSLELITESQVANVEDFIDSFNKKN